MSEAPRLVEVVWLDSSSDSGWRSAAEALRAAREDSALEHRSVGYELADEPAFVLLTMSWRPPSEDDHAMVSDTLQIPRPAILEVRELAARPRRNR